jgi:hypothetical protein
MEVRIPWPMIDSPENMLPHAIVGLSLLLQSILVHEEMLKLFVGFELLDLASDKILSLFYILDLLGLTDKFLVGCSNAILVVAGDSVLDLLPEFLHHLACHHLFVTDLCSP